MSKQDPRKVFAQAIVDLGKQHDDLVAVSCDSASGGGLSPFQQAYPDRLVECGIGEQNATSVSAGLALRGLNPVLVAITPFISMRNYEQVRDDIGYTNLGVTIVASGGGLQYSTLGSTHEAIEDIALMRTVPNMVVLTPSDGYEVAKALELAVNHDGPVYLRMPRHALEDLVVPGAREYAIGGMQALTADTNADTAIFAAGVMVHQAYEAAKLLKDKGISAKVVNVHTIKPLNMDKLVALAGSCGQIFTVEEHVENGGLGTAVLEALANAGKPMKVKRIGVVENHVVNTGPYDEILDFYGFSPEKICKTVSETLGK